MKSKLFLLFLLLISIRVNSETIEVWPGETFSCNFRPFANTALDILNIEWEYSESGLEYDTWNDKFTQIYHASKYSSNELYVTVKWTETDLYDNSSPFYHKSHTWSIKTKNNPISVPKEISLNVGEQKVINFSFQYQNSYTKNAVVTFRSLDATVATVDKNTGKVTAKNSGVADIVVESSISKERATCTVVVTPNVIKVSGITIAGNSSDPMIVGDTRQLSATVKPSDATDKSVTWSSSSSVASVSSTGLVTAITRGTATITCSAQDGSGVTAECSITVNEKPQIELVAKPSGGEVKKGTKITLQAILNGYTVDADIYYTMNGDMPTKYSKKYASGIIINEACTLKAIVYMDNTESEVYTWNYTIEDKVVAEINSTNFPDDNFRKYLLSQDYGSDGILTESEISNISVIMVPSENINNLKGIEFFTSLNSLYCNNNNLTSLDLTKNTLLKYLDCNYNNLTNLNVSRNSALRSLCCDFNNLFFLNVTSNSALESLSCSANQLSSLIISRNYELIELVCTENNLTELDLSQNEKLLGLACYNNQLIELNCSKNPALIVLYCHNNELSSLDVTNNKELTNLSCFNNKIKGVAMDKLINSLPQNKTNNIYHFYCIDPTSEIEGNVCTKKQISAVKERGWLPCYYDVATDKSVEYEGSDEEEFVPIDGYVFQKTTMLESGNNYLLLAADGSRLRLATPLASDKSYGYLYCNDITEENGTIKQDDLTNTFKIETTMGGYTIKQSDGRYLFQKGQYDSFNADMNPTEGHVWYVMPNNDGTFKILNASVGKYIQYSTTYGSYGSYTDEKGIMPSLYALKSVDAGVTNILMDKSKNTLIYNLSGQRLSTLQKGINIIGGRKVVVK